MSDIILRPKDKKLNRRPPMPSRVHGTGGNQHGSSPEEAADNLRLKGLRESAEGLRIDCCQGDHRGKIGWGWG